MTGKTQKGKEKRKLTEIVCQTGEEEITWRDQPKELTSEDWEREREERVQKRRNLKKLIVSKEESEVRNVVAVLVAHTKLWRR